MIIRTLAIVWMLLTAIVMLIGGGYFSKGGPKKINRFVGYRTRMAMKNQDTWEFAHKYCGKIWLRAGLIMLALTAIPVTFLLARENIDLRMVISVSVATVFLQGMALLISIIPTEVALRKNFDKDGNSKIDK